MTARHRILNCLVICAFQLTTIFSAQSSFAAAPTVLGLPAPGTMVNLSSRHVPAIMKAVHINQDNPLLFDFIVDTGNSGLNGDTPELRKEAEKLIKYFLATLTIPEKSLWVNLSPYENDRIVNGSLGQTELGRDLLAQDYMLKQLTASMLYPEKSMGRKFWNQIYKQAEELFGTTQIPVNTFNKVWILPDSATIFVRGNTAYLLEGHMKVMLEEDYLAMNQNMGGATDAPKTNTVGNKIVRQVILPAIEDEVNNGKNFAQLRQIFNSVVLASWYKRNLKQALLNQVYSDRAKINGVNVNDQKIAEKIYHQYQAAYKKGVFSYIREDYDRLSQQPIPRKYFSGGFRAEGGPAVENPTIITDEAQLSQRNRDMLEPTGDALSITTLLHDAARVGRGPSMKDLIAGRATDGAAADRASVAERTLTPAEKTRAVQELSGKVPAAVIKDVEGGVVTTSGQVEALRLLVSAGQEHVLDTWANHEPQDRQALLAQVNQLNDSYSGGIQAYRTNGVKLLAQSAKGESAFAGYKPQVPRGTDLTTADQKTIDQMESNGLKEFNRIVAVLPAGGQGDRLGYDGIKVGIPLDLVTRKTYLQNYAESVLAYQTASNKLNGEKREVPLVIMTSDATHDATVKLLEDNNYFGMNGLSVNPTKEQVTKGDVRQIIILRQNMVPAMQNNKGDFVLAPGDKYRLEVKAHGHGDIHMLIHQSGLDERFAKEGNTHLLFFQDTNGQAFNAVLPGIANSVQHNFDMNFLTTSRAAGEAAGAIVRMERPDGQVQTMNVEYNELGPFLKSVSSGKIERATLDQIAAGAGPELLSSHLLGEQKEKDTDYYVIEGKNLPAIEARLTSAGVPQAKEIMKALNAAVPGDIADARTGKSPFPGNLNVFIVKADAYQKKLADTGGIFGEFINPKYADAERQSFQSPTRTETMMQDIAKYFPGDRVGFTNFDRLAVFSPVKNSITRAQGVVGPEKTVPADAMVTGEADLYTVNRRKLAEAGVQIDVTGVTQEMHGIPYTAGAKVVLATSFAPTHDMLRARFEGKNSVSPASTFVVGGQGDVKFANLTLDGTLKVNAAKGVTVTLKDMNVQNAGTEIVPLSAAELKDGSIPQAERMRGYRMVEHAATVIDIQQPGTYEVTPQDVTLRVPVVNESAAKEKLRAPLRIAVGNQDAFQGLMNRISQTVGQSAPAERDVVVTLAGNTQVPLKSLGETPETDITGVTFTFPDKSTVRVDISGPQPVLQMRAKADNLPQRLGSLAQSIFADQIAQPDRAMSGGPERRSAATFSAPLNAMSGGFVPSTTRGGTKDVGGIDLNADKMSTKIFGEHVNIRFDPAMIQQFKRGDFTGVRPEILRVTPIPSVLPLFGMSPSREEKPALLAKVS